MQRRPASSPIKAPVFCWTDLQSRFTRAQWSAAAAAFLLYAAVLVFMLPRHEPWADEAQAWELAGHASLCQIFHTYIHYEISPGLWHGLLWVLIKLHLSYTGLHWFCAGAATAAMLLLVLGAPFPLRLKLLLPFTFYFVYQYALIARSYVLFAPLLFALAWLWPQRSARPVCIALLLGLLANLSAHGLCVAFGLALAWAIDIARDRRNASATLRRWWLPALLLVLLFGLAGWCLVPAHDADWVAGARLLNSNAARSKITHDLTARHPWQHALPLPLQWAISLSARFLSVLWQSLSSIKLAGLAAWLLLLWRCKRERLLRYGIPVLLLAIFCTVTKFKLYHAGLLWELFLFLWWITWPRQHSQGASSWSETVLTALATICIASQLVWAVDAVRFDFAATYSPDRDAAPELRRLLNAGRPVDLAVPLRVGVPQHSEYFAVGLEPYFAAEPLHNMRARFWIWNDDSAMRSAYLRDTAARSVNVLLEVMKEDSRWQDEDRWLRANGYTPASSFCGTRFDPWVPPEPLCHVFYTVP